jgi:hypothetical protein
VFGDGTNRLPGSRGNFRKLVLHDGVPSSRTMYRFVCLQHTRKNRQSQLHRTAIPRLTTPRHAAKGGDSARFDPLTIVKHLVVLLAPQRGNHDKKHPVGQLSAGPPPGQFRRHRNPRVR